LGSIGPFHYRVPGYEILFSLSLLLGSIGPFHYRVPGYEILFYTQLYLYYYDTLTHITFD